MVEAEKQLLLQIESGDEEAFALLYTRYFSLVKELVVKFLKCSQLSEDIAQDVFMNIWNSRDHLSHVISFKAYVLGAARNRALNSLKQISRDRSKINQFKNAYESRNSGEEELVSEEYEQYLKKVIESMPPQTQRVFDLCRIQNKKYEEAAQMLEVSPNTIKKHIMRANHTFKTAFKEILRPVGSSKSTH